MTKKEIISKIKKVYFLSPDIKNKWLVSINDGKVTKYGYELISRVIDRYDLQFKEIFAKNATPEILGKIKDFEKKAIKDLILNKEKYFKEDLNNS